MDELKEKIKKETEEIKKEVREKTFGYIITGLSLVGALAWNDAIKAFIEQIFPLDKNGLLAKFIYATIVTIIIVILTVYLTKLLRKNENQ